MYEEKSYFNSSTLLAFVIGGAIGAGIALLTAPRSGKETRDLISDKTEEYKEKIKSATSDARLKIADVLSRTKEEGRTMVSGAMEAGKRAMEEERQRMAGS